MTICQLQLEHASHYWLNAHTDTRACRNIIYTELKHWQLRTSQSYQPALHSLSNKRLLHSAVAPLLFLYLSPFNLIPILFLLFSPSLSATMWVTVKSSYIAAGDTACPECAQACVHVCVWETRGVPVSVQASGKDVWQIKVDHHSVHNTHKMSQSFSVKEETITFLYSFMQLALK